MYFIAFGLSLRLVNWPFLLSFFSPPKYSIITVKKIEKEENHLLQTFLLFLKKDSRYKKSPKKNINSDILPSRNRIGDFSIDNRDPLQSNVMNQLHHRECETKSLNPILVKTCHKELGL